MAEFGRNKRHSAFIAAMASGHSIRDSAKLANVAERTAYRWNAEPEFRKTVLDIRNQTVEAVTAGLTSAATQAVQTLKDLTSSSNDAARLGAAKAILDQGCRHREQYEILDILKSLEGKLNELGKKNPAAVRTGGNPFPPVPKCYT